MARIALALALLTLTGCASKKSSPAAAALADELAGADVPNDAASQSFARRVLKHPASNFRPTDGDGAVFTYATMEFRGDNTWLANATMVADGETIECQEKGTWAMDPAEDDHTAVMTWRLNKTTCPGRPSEHNMRVHVRIDDHEWKIVMR